MTPLLPDESPASNPPATAFVRLELNRCQWSGSGTVVVVVIAIDLFGLPK